VKRLYICGSFLAIATLTLLSAGAGEDAPKSGNSGKEVSNMLTKHAARFGLPEAGTSTRCGLVIGDSLPSIECVDLEGNSVRLGEFYGERGTLIICWATWCGPCMGELPHEVALARAYKDKGLNVIGINGDEDPATAKMVHEVLRIDWPTIHAPKDDAKKAGILKTLGINEWPTVLLLDHNHKLVAASPDLNSTTITEDGDGDAYAIRALDWMLTRQLGPLDWVPVISPVN